MSLSNTIAHEGAAPARGFSLKGIGVMAAGLALGVGISFVIINNGTAPESTSTGEQSAAGLAHADFLRLNTTSYDGLVPAASAAVVESQAAVDSDFLYWNIGSLEYGVAGYTEQAGGPR